MQSIIKNQIQNFLASEAAEVIAIKGPWGVGKTYAWNSWLKEAADSKDVACKRYAYVSLFGLKSIDDVKQAIFQQTQTIDTVGIPASIETFKEDPFGIMKQGLRFSFSRHSSSLVGLLSSGRLSFNPLSMSYFLVKDQIICLDDLERREESLSDTELMGLVNQLKIEKNCKVVLVFNDGESNFNAYETYREKVIDRELQFQTTPTDAFNIAFEDVSIPPELLSLIEASTAMLGITNIRILLKVKSHMLELLEVLGKCDDLVLQDALKHLVLFTWCFYAKGEQVPSLDYALNIFPKRYYDETLVYPSEAEKRVARENGNEGEIQRRIEHIEKHKKLNHTLEQAGYTERTLLNHLTAQGVMAGYFDSPQWQAAIQERSNYYSHASVNQQFSDLFDAYRYSFADNSKELISGYYELTANNLEAVNASRLQTVVFILRELGEGAKADDLIDRYIAFYDKPTDAERFDMYEINTFGEIEDVSLIEKFNVHFQSLADEGDPLEVFEKLAESRNPDKQEQALLNRLTTDDFVAYFKQLKGRAGYMAIKQCLKLDEEFGVDVNGADIRERAAQALKQIASENNLNRRRIAQLYGVE